MLQLIRLTLSVSVIISLVNWIDACCQVTAIFMECALNSIVGQIGLSKDFLIIYTSCFIFSVLNVAARPGRMLHFNSEQKPFLIQMSYVKMSYDCSSCSLDDQCVFHQPSVQEPQKG